jgi:hypothetical protein
MDQNPGAGSSAREIAATLVDAAIGPGADGNVASKRIHTTSGRRSRR